MIFYSTLVFLLVASLTGLAIATAMLPYERTRPLPARGLAQPISVATVS